MKKCRTIPSGLVGEQHCHSNSVLHGRAHDGVTPNRGAQLPVLVAGDKHGHDHRICRRTCFASHNSIMQRGMVSHCCTNGGLVRLFCCCEQKKKVLQRTHTHFTTDHNARYSAAASLLLRDHPGKLLFPRVPLPPADVHIAHAWRESVSLGGRHEWEP